MRALTPMLISGSAGATKVLREGALAPGFNGTLCEHVFADGRHRQETTVVLTPVPETLAYVPALVCRDRATLGGGNPAQLPAERWTAVELESVAFNERYHLLTLAGQDQGWVRELFSPELIAWLTDRAPAGLSFELNEGHLAIAQPGPPAGDGAIDGLIAAAQELRTRIRDEALEEEADPDLFDESAEVAAVVATIDEVEWPEPPPSVGAADTRYALAARWKPRVMANGALVGSIAGAITIVILTLLANDLLALAAGFIVAVAGFVVGQWYASHRFRWGNVSVQRVALEAWVRGYARSRGLELVDRWRWHSDHRALPLPGFADHVLAGEIPGTNATGWFAMLGDAAELRSTGQEIAYASDRPLASSALVMRLERPPSEDELRALKLPENYSLEHAGDEVCVWLAVQGNLMRTSKGSDNFRRKAGAALAELTGAG
jgi:hypothetical protein